MSNLAKRLICRVILSVCHVQNPVRGKILSRKFFRVEVEAEFCDFHKYSGYSCKFCNAQEEKGLHEIG